MRTLTLMAASLLLGDNDGVGETGRLDLASIAPELARRLTAAGRAAGSSV